ncbi:MAG: carbohydrate porin, partial [Puniceicoccales bacterium]|nr:carbohydrate porin [Puniceicoccales bacterium]
LLVCAALIPLLSVSSYASGKRAGVDPSTLKNRQTKTVETADFSDFSEGLAQWWNGDGLTGDWFGYRTQLEDSGVIFFGSYEQDLAGNPYGGVDQGITNSGSIEFGVLLDFEKIAKLNGTSLLVRVVDRNGSDLSGKYIGNYFPVQQDYGVETIMLQSLALEQKLFDDVLSIKLGRVAMGDDFATSPFYGLYMSNAIDGTPKALTTTSAFSCYPGSVWGGRVQFTSPDKQFYAKAGVYQASSRLYDGHRNGIGWGIRGEDGITTIAELGWTPELFKQEVRTPSGQLKTVGLPGHYFVGAYTTHWDVARFDGNGYESFSHAFYFHADQKVYAPEPGSDQGLSLWAVFILAPQESIQVLPYQVSGGLSYKGLIPGRERDNLILGASYGHFGDDYARQQQALTGENPSGETIIELAYAAQLNDFLIFQPDIQYVINPSGRSSIDDALVLGLRLKVVF